MSRERDQPTPTSSPVGRAAHRGPNATFRGSRTCGRSHEASTGPGHRKRRSVRPEGDRPAVMFGRFDRVRMPRTRHRTGRSTLGNGGPYAGDARDAGGQGRRAGSRELKAERSGPWSRPASVVRRRRLPCREGGLAEARNEASMAACTVLFMDAWRMRRCISPAHATPCDPSRRSRRPPVARGSGDRASSSGSASGRSSCRSR